MPFPQPMYNFNPRSREGSDSFSLNWRIFLFLFQSTLPRRERPDLSMNCTIFNIISIHAPAKGATNCLSHMHLQSYYFNPRSREGSDVRLSCRAVLPWISIHAPAKGATRYNASGDDGLVFQSTLPRRERLIIPQQKKWSTVFQSTLPRRERLVSYLESDTYHNISIHAPAKGATCMTVTRWELQSHFNPRSREGSDILPDKYKWILDISIHAPAKGATKKLRVSHRGFCISIHAPAKGATVRETWCALPVNISIHAPAKGATLRRTGDRE